MGVTDINTRTLTHTHNLQGKGRDPNKLSTLRLDWNVLHGSLVELPLFKVIEMRRKGPARTTPAQPSLYNFPIEQEIMAAGND